MRAAKAIFKGIDFWRSHWRYEILTYVGIPEWPDKRASPIMLLKVMRLDIDGRAIAKAKFTYRPRSADVQDTLTEQQVFRYRREVYNDLMIKASKEEINFSNTEAEILYEQIFSTVFPAGFFLDVHTDDGAHWFLPEHPSNMSSEPPEGWTQGTQTGRWSSSESNQSNLS